MFSYKQGEKNNETVKDRSVTIVIDVLQQISPSVNIPAAHNKSIYIVKQTEKSLRCSL